MSIFGIVVVIGVCCSLLGLLAGTGIGKATQKSHDIEIAQKRLEAISKNVTKERVLLDTHMRTMINRAENVAMQIQDFQDATTTTTTTAFPPGFYIPKDHMVIVKPVTPSAGKRKSKGKLNSLRRQKRGSPWGAPPANGTGGRLIELEDDASVDTNSTKTMFKTRVLESGLIAPNLGLVMEQTGSYMEYSGYIYIPTIYHMPHLATTELTGKGESCNITSNAEHQKMIVNLLKDKIGVLIPQHQSHRQKRFLETLLIGGVAAWNRASIWSLQDTVSSLEAQMSLMREHGNIVTSSVNTLIDNQHAIHHAVDRQARILKEFLDRSTCEELITNYFREVYSTWLALAPNDFSRVVDSALSGKITPDLLPATDVLNVLLKHPALVSTAYSRDMTLLYELGKFSLHQVNYDPYPMVSGIMVFPRILMDRSAALMRVHTTYSRVPSGYRKLELPDVVACKDKTNCWEISPTACKEMLTLTLCPKTTQIEFNGCLKHLMVDRNPTSACSWKVSMKPDLEVIPFDGGVLISASNMTGAVMVSQGKDLIVHSQVDPSNTPTVLTAADGDYLHMGGQIFQLTQETLKTGYEINTDLTIPNQQETLGDVTWEGWVDEKKIPQMRNAPWAPPHHYTWWLLVGSLICLLILGGFLFRYRVVVGRLHSRVKEEISGWVTVPTAPPSYQGHRHTMKPRNDIVV